MTSIEKSFVFYVDDWQENNRRASENTEKLLTGVETIRGNARALLITAKRSKYSTYYLSRTKFSLDRDEANSIISKYRYILDQYR